MSKEYQSIFFYDGELPLVIKDSCLIAHRHKAKKGLITKARFTRCLLPEEFYTDIKIREYLQCFRQSIHPVSSRDHILFYTDSGYVGSDSYTLTIINASNTIQTLGTTTTAVGTDINVTNFYYRVRK